MMLSLNWTFSDYLSQWQRQPGMLMTLLEVSPSLPSSVPHSAAALALLHCMFQHLELARCFKGKNLTSGPQQKGKVKAPCFSPPASRYKSLNHCHQWANVLFIIHSQLKPFPVLVFSLGSSVLCEWHLSKLWLSLLSVTEKGWCLILVKT